MTEMMVTSDPAPLRALSSGGGTIALVPTMGALHEGHLSLVRAAKKHADRVVVSIFVNPTQFGEGEDYDQYPRTRKEDLAALAALGVDAAFVPDVELLYPGYPSPALVTVDPGPQAKILEGAIRPGHFAGVAQVVAKLFHLVQPDVAVFGQKDAQQLAIIRQMVRDLNFPVQIVAVPTVREEDGLALSSRNAYLNPAERRAATALFRGLQQGRRLAEAGSPPAQVVHAAWREMASTNLVDPQYSALVFADDFAPALVRTPMGWRPQSAGSGPMLLLLAAQVGPARLIDNTEVELNHAPAR